MPRFRIPSVCHPEQSEGSTRSDFLSHLSCGALQLIAIISASIVCGALFSAVTASAAATKASQQEVAEALTCQCGCGLTVANCNHPNCEFSVPVREKIDAMLAHGMGRTEIIAYFRTQYGEKILSAPTTQGFNILAWTMPFMALAAGCALIVFTVGRWHKVPPAPASPETPPPDQAAFDPDLRRRLERELKERI